MFLGQKTAMLSLFQLSIYLQLILYGLGHVTWHNNGYTKLFFFSWASLQLTAAMFFLSQITLSLGIWIKYFKPKDRILPSKTICDNRQIQNWRQSGGMTGIHLWFLKALSLRNWIYEFLRTWVSNLKISCGHISALIIPSIQICHKRQKSLKF